MELIKNSYLLYKGPSLFNGEEIAVIITGLTTPSSNRKTGVMLQSWIIPTAEKPTEAVKAGRDAANCGDCPLRGKSCYVNVVTVNNIYGHSHELPPISDHVLDYIRQSGIGLRLGAYGDPVMAPFSAWEPLIKAAKFSLGYTHQWHWCDPVWKDYCQASVENEDDKKRANLLGWGTYRIKMPDDTVKKDEIICRYQQNNHVKCSSCRLCNGNKNIVADVHGNAAKLYQFKKLVHDNNNGEAIRILKGNHL